MQTTLCKICAAGMTVFDTAQVLRKYQVSYYHCPRCGFVQTEEPYWLNEAYTKAISRLDTGVMARNMNNAANLLFFLRFIPDGPCLDFGGGHGVLTRMMRDYGFDFYHCDKYAENLFAAGFEGDLAKKYNLITSFENFEHFANPMKEIKNMLSSGNALYFTTELITGGGGRPPRIKDWWYYTPNTGQHIAFYAKTTLEYIAKTFNMRLLTDDHSTHILYKDKLNTQFFTMLKVYRKLNALRFSRLFQRPSKTWDDMMNLKRLET
ncbi:MAG: class I SAM-dependent methyltransferase [Treponematales bacterium]